MRALSRNGCKPRVDRIRWESVGSSGWKLIDWVGEQRERSWSREPVIPEELTPVQSRRSASPDRAPDPGDLWDRCVTDDACYLRGRKIVSQKHATTKSVVRIIMQVSPIHARGLDTRTLSQYLCWQLRSTKLYAEIYPLWNALLYYVETVAWLHPLPQIETITCNIRKDGFSDKNKRGSDCGKIDIQALYLYYPSWIDGLEDCIGIRWHRFSIAK